MSDAWLIVGLGNPGPDYATHRHNVGHMVVAQLCADLRLSLKRHKANAMVAEGRFRPGTDKIIVATCLSYMNTSGGPVGALVKYFDVAPERVIVIHDDIDIPFDTVRLKLGGGHGGQNGVRSIMGAIGPDFLRVRVGVGRPAGRKDAADHVLESFSKQEREVLPHLVVDACDAVERLVIDGLSSAQLHVHTAKP